MVSVGFRWFSLVFAGFRWFSLVFVGFRILGTPKKKSKTGEKFVVDKIDPVPENVIYICQQDFWFGLLSY